MLLWLLVLTLLAPVASLECTRATNVTWEEYTYAPV